MYTSQGLMTQADYAEYLKDTDQGATDIDIAGDDIPPWFDLGRNCPLDGVPLWNHEAVRVTDASGEVFACDDGTGWKRDDVGELW